MRIYGGHDYYDCMLGYGFDPTVVLVRTSESIDPKEVSVPSAPMNVRLFENGWENRDMRELRVVFCSKVYYGIEVLYKGVVHYFWQADKLQAWVSTQKGLTLKSTHRHWRDWKREFTLEDYFVVVDAPDPLRNWMIVNRYAILLSRETDNYSPPEVTANPHSLKTYGFAKAIDPYTAYQELSMWVGGVLAGESPKTVKITDDKVLIENHGFDKVFSFRGPRLK